MKLRDANLQVYEKNSFTYPPSCILPLFSKNASRLLLPKRLLKCANKISFRKYEQKVVPTGTPRGVDLDLTSILSSYVEDQISTNFHVISTYFFGVISPIEKSMSFPHIFFNAISLFEKSTLFPRTFFGVILLIEKSTLFPHTFFDVISMVEKSTLFPCTFFGVISLFEKSALFPLTIFDVISMLEKSTLFPLYLFQCNYSGRNIHVVSTYFIRRNFDGQKFDIIFGKLQANENIRGFPVFVTLNSRLLQDCSL